MLVQEVSPTLAAEVTPKIRLRQISKTFETRGGPVTALDNVSLDIPTGCFFVIVGPSGCGKTTLLRMLGKLETPSSGTIEIGSPDSNRPEDAMVFQGDSLFPWMTVSDNAHY